MQGREDTIVKILIRLPLALKATLDARAADLDRSQNWCGVEAISQYLGKPHPNIRQEEALAKLKKGAKKK
ncbi:MAG: hypothetical protein Q8O94_03645 [bacterium]|nr:hypothetical protein [bacterium]